MERVYFFGRDGLIKVGTTVRDVKERLRQIELTDLNGPITLIGAIAGGFQLEGAIHRHLASYRVRGEWFSDCTEVRSCIAKLLTEGPSSIGFDQSIERIGKAARDQYAVLDRSYKPDLFGNTARLIWPETALEELCALSGFDEAVVASWLSGEVKPPRLVRCAFAAVVAAAITPGGIAYSFLGCGEDETIKIPLPEFHSRR
jgi:hypothetical protein